MPSWKNPSTWGKSVEQQRRDRDQQYRDARAEARTEYLADIAGDGGGDCEDDGGDD